MPTSFLKYAELYPNAAQRHMERMGNKIAALRKRGICTHGWIQGQPTGGADGPIKCLDCGATFANYAAHEEARQSALNS